MLLFYLYPACSLGCRLNLQNLHLQSLKYPKTFSAAMAVCFVQATTFLQTLLLSYNQRCSSERNGLLLPCLSYYSCSAFPAKLNESYFLFNKQKWPYMGKNDFIFNKQKVILGTEVHNFLCLPFSAHLQRAAAPVRLDASSTYNGKSGQSVAD